MRLGLVSGQAIDRSVTAPRPGLPSRDAVTARGLLGMSPYYDAAEIQTQPQGKTSGQVAWNKRMSSSWSSQWRRCAVKTRLQQAG